MEIREINLLYTHWNGTNPLPNANELGYDTTFTDFAGYIETHLNFPHYDDYENYPRGIKINKKSLTEYDVNQTYFYCVSHPSLCLDEILDTGLPINESVIELSIKNNNIYFVFSYEHEGDSDDIFPKILDRIQRQELDDSKFVIINNNSRIYNSRDFYNCKLKVHKCNFITYSSLRVLKNIETKFSSEKEGKFFICRNRAPKEHRVALLCNLAINDILDEVNYSFIPEGKNGLQNINSLIKYFKVSFIKENRDIITKINSTGKIDDYEAKTNWINPENFNFQSDQGQIFLVPEMADSFNNSYVNIVTESIFERKFNVIHHSEKSFRPFYYYQFPIYLASPEHVRFLEEEYGFDMFRDIINHDSYDLEWNDKLRFNLVFEEIQRINNSKEKFKEFYKNNQDRFIKNKEIYIKIAKEGQIKDFDFIWNML